MGLHDGWGEQPTSTPPPNKLEELASLGVALGCSVILGIEGAIRGIKDFVRALADDVKDVFGRTNSSPRT